MYKNLIRVGVLLSSLVLLGSLGSAQSTNGGAQQLPPISPLGPDKTVGGTLPAPGDLSPGADQQGLPDSRPVAGAQELTLGSSVAAHNFLLPSFSVVTQVGANPSLSTSSTSPGTLSSSFLAGRLGLNRIGGGSEFLLDYIGGASFSNDPTLGNALIQGLDMTETVRRGRWSVLFGDHFTYLSSSPFGFGGVGGLKNLGVGLGNGVGSSPGISSSFTPSGSIYINGVPRAQNAVIGQATYALSHRSALTFVGSLGTLNFIKSPLEDDRVTTFQGGYTYLLSRLNSVSVIYRFDAFSFSALPQGIHNHSGQVAFARRITGRLSWQVGGGPSIQEYLKPLSGSGTVVGPTAFTGLGYRRRYTGFSVTYAHGLTNGSGVLPGAETDTFSGQVNRTFGKNWDSTIDAGYSRNQAVRQTSATTVLASPSTWFASGRISRRFVGYGALFISYNASGQSSLASVCTLPGCRFSSMANAVSVGYTWGLRPVVLE
jgi:hypothetical protein